jgi:flagellar FliJ protein
MAKFVFKLQAILRHREHVEREKQREVANRRKVLDDAYQELRDLNDRVQQTIQDVRANHLLGVLDMGFLAGHRRYMLASNRQAGALAQKIASAKTAFDAAQTELLVAAKQRKILDKLREKQLMRWQDENHRREMIAQDEISTQLGFAAQNVSTTEAM